MQVKRWEECRKGACEAELTRQLEANGYQVTRYVYPPGTLFPEHSHDVDKVDVVLSGEFRFSMQGESVVLGSGESVEVPRGVSHSAEVLGDEPVVSLDAIKY